MKRNFVVFLVGLILFSCAPVGNDPNTQNNQSPAAEEVRVITTPVPNPILTPPENRLTEDGDDPHKREEIPREPTTEGIRK